MWNYRMVETVSRGESSFGIHEAYYNEDGSIYAITKEPVAAVGANTKELAEEIRHMRLALRKPVIPHDFQFSDRRP